MKAVHGCLKKFHFHVKCNGERPLKADFRTTGLIVRYMNQRKLLLSQRLNPISQTL